MTRRSVLFAVALAVMSLAGSAAQAGTIVVSTDSGSVGGFTMTNLGISGGVASLEITGLPGASSRINTVNGVTVPAEPVSVSTPVLFSVTPTGSGTYSITPTNPPYTKTIGDTPGAQAIMDFNLSTGATPPVLPQFFNAGRHHGLAGERQPDLRLFPVLDRGNYQHHLHRHHFRWGGRQLLRPLLDGRCHCYR